jgi:prolipoprotein diacylglyceryltransferase
MGMLLSVPMVIAGAVIIMQTLRRGAPQASKDNTAKTQAGN